MLDARRLLVLTTVAKTGSLTAAAEALSYSVPSVWQQIRRLEADVGQPLVRSHSRGVTLTTAGQALAAHATDILRQMRMAESELQAMHELQTGALRLASFASAGAGLLPEAIAAFSAEHPAVELSLVECEPPQAFDALRDGEIDLALVFAFGEPRAHETLEHVALLDDPLFVALPTGHPLAAQEKVSLRSLRSQPWIKGVYTVEESDADGAEALALPRSKVAFQGGDFMTVQGLVAAGAGVAVIPRLALHALRPDVVVRPLSGRAGARRIFASTLAPPFRSAAAERFLEALSARADALREEWGREAPVSPGRSRRSR
jgi:molybdate transport repressor ModE-like protein